MATETYLRSPLIIDFVLFHSVPFCSVLLYASARSSFRFYFPILLPLHHLILFTRSLFLYPCVQMCFTKTKAKSRLRNHRSTFYFPQHPFWLKCYFVAVGWFDFVSFRFVFKMIYKQQKRGRNNSGNSSSRINNIECTIHVLVVRSVGWLVDRLRLSHSKVINNETISDTSISRMNRLKIV